MDISKKDAIIHFFQNNPISYSDKFSTEKHPNCIFTSINDGVLLGEQPNEHIMSFNTFISNEMLKKQQIDMNNTQTEAFKEYIKQYYDIEVQ